MVDFFFCMEQGKIQIEWNNWNRLTVNSKFQSSIFDNAEASTASRENAAFIVFHFRFTVLGKRNGRDKAVTNKWEEDREERVCLAALWTLLLYIANYGNQTQKKNPQAHAYVVQYSTRYYFIEFFVCQICVWMIMCTPTHAFWMKWKRRLSLKCWLNDISFTVINGRHRFWWVIVYVCSSAGEPT